MQKSAVKRLIESELVLGQKMGRAKADKIAEAVVDVLSGMNVISVEPSHPQQSLPHTEIVGSPV